MTNDIFNTVDRWGLTEEEYFRFIETHKNARQRGDIDMMEKIEDRLEDINFHPECRALHDGDYAKAESLWRDENEET